MGAIHRPPRYVKRGPSDFDRLAERVTALKSASTGTLTPFDWAVLAQEIRDIGERQAKTYKAGFEAGREAARQEAAAKTAPPHRS